MIEPKNPVKRVDNTEMAEQSKMPFGGYTHLGTTIFVMLHSTLYYCLACSANLYEVLYVQLALISSF